MQKNYSNVFKFKVVMEVIRSDLTIAEGSDPIGYSFVFILILVQTNLEKIDRIKLQN